MISFPASLSDLPLATGEIRAGATDLTERRHLRISQGDVIDLRDLSGLDVVLSGPTETRIGALTRISAVASHPDIVAGYPAFAAAAGGLATPQIRAMATVGGNLLQRVRCPYYRSPEFTCFQKGGSICPARTGDHLYLSCFDKGPCIAPHPSTLGAALLAYEGSVDLSSGERLSAADLFGDGSDGHRSNRLPEKALLSHVLLPAPLAGERGVYLRAIARARAEWPLVEVAVRLVMDGETIKFARVAVGGVAPVPLRLTSVEAALEGQQRTAIGGAAGHAADGATPLPQTAYKTTLLVNTVLSALERAVEMA